jgi:ABC-type glutathione transport system ATPase component
LTRDETGRTVGKVLITTHHLRVAEAPAHRLELMHAGGTARSGTRTEIAAGHPSAKPTVAERFSIRRTARLTRLNSVLLFRDRLAFFYAVLMPLLPLALLFTGERGSPAVGAAAIVIMFQVIAIVPVYDTTCSPGS